MALNYIEGYARMRSKVHKNFIEISYGSLKESLYLIDFVYKENFISETDHLQLSTLGEEISRMLWGMLQKMSQD